MGLFLFRFWPVLIPLLIYCLWFLKVGRAAVKAGNPHPHFRDGPWYWAVLASLATGIVCFVALGSSTESTTDDYVPPHMENGRLIPGHEGAGR